MSDAEDRIRILEVNHRHLTDQMAELVVGMHAVKSCLQTGESRMTGIETELRANSATTAEVRDILATAKVGLRALGGIGTVVRWIGYLAAAGAAIYTGWHMIMNGGRPPGPP